MAGGRDRPLATVAVAAAATTGVLLLLYRRRRRRPPAKFCLERVLRPSILRVKAYAFPPRYEYTDPVLLDANENPHGPPLDDPSLLRLSLERYPDPRQGALKASVAKLRGVRPEEVFLGVGSDEAIDMIIRVFCTPGVDSIVVCPPTYSMYSVFAAINDVGVVSVPLTPAPDFQMRLDAIVAALNPRTKVIFLCSPGNPTGRSLAMDELEAVLKAATGSVVVVDEAYIDFAPGGGGSVGSKASAVSLFRSGKHPNLIVMQTLSKAWGLAGARLGMAFMPQPMIEVFAKVKAPFNVSALTEDAVLRALARPELVDERVKTILSERERVAAAVKALQPKISGVYPSEANFLLFQAPGAKTLSETLARDGSVVVRYRGSMLHCEDCIRVTIGTKAENDQFLQALKTALA